MLVVYKEGTVDCIGKLDYESMQAVKKAIELTREKSGFKSIYGEVMNNCTLEITMGFNIYHTHIHLIPDNDDWQIERYAYYCQGSFYGSFSRQKVELI